MTNLAARTISGIILILVYLGAILFSEYSLLALMIIIYTLGITEFRKMFRVENIYLYLLSVLSGQIFIVFNYLTLTDNIRNEWYILFIISALTAYLIYYLLFKNTSISRVSIMFISSAWLAGALSFYLGLGWVTQLEAYDPVLLIAAMVLIWVHDVSAYVVGSLFGKHLLAPKISPGKTIEGFIGGILFNLLAGYIIYLITDQFSMLFWMLTGFAVSLGATTGDLFESKLKREAGVKDSGKLIPGHGGILDRFDSLFFTAPLIYIMYLISNWL